MLPGLIKDAIPKPVAPRRRRRQNGRAAAADSGSSARRRAGAAAFRARPSAASNVPTVILHYMSRQKLLKIQTYKKCRAATRLLTIRSQFYLLVTNVGAGLQTSQNDPSREIHQYRYLRWDVIGRRLLITSVRPSERLHETTNFVACSAPLQPSFWHSMPSIHAQRRFCNPTGSVAVFVPCTKTIFLNYKNYRLLDERSVVPASRGYRQGRI